MLTAYLANEGHGLVLATAITTAIVAALPLVFRLGDRITEAAYCKQEAEARRLLPSVH